MSRSRKPKWKVAFLNNPKPLFLYDFRSLVSCFSMRWRETFDVFYPEDEDWILCHTNYPTKTCNCGRAYNGFRYRDAFLNGPQTQEEAIAWIHKPLLCEFCYYKREHGRGNWIPRKLRRELGLED